MGRVTCLLLLQFILDVGANTYSVRVSTQHHVNEVGVHFLSFSIDPKYLFSTNERDSKECVCMAGSLSPAYLRIAGPSTESLEFANSSMVIADDGERRLGGVKVTDEQWTRFSKWAKAAGFSLVFGLNPSHKTRAGMWDANSAITLLTSAEQHQIDNIVWELGHECSNQSIEEYLNDLQTLKVIVETFPRGAEQSWKVVAGDVTNCLQADSKSDFKDYITISSEWMDAILLNGKTTAQELDKMPEIERAKLLRHLSTSKTPLWLTERSQPQMSELERAVDWLISLGYSARNGFNVHFRELREDELYEPTLSFYMALLYKNLVGERVLNVETVGSGRAALFAHCTALRHRPVSAAVTLYAANVDDESARFSVKLSRTEEGGDVMQFIVGKEVNGTIMVNGRAMHHEGDIRPVVKRVRPYKTLLLNLPPKSYGFWVLANTNIEACHDFEASEVDGKNYVEAVHVTDINDKVFNDKIKRMERSIIKDTNRMYDDVTDYSEEESYDGEIDISRPEIEEDITDTSREELITLVDNISRDFRHAFPELVEKWNRKRDTKRSKREVSEPKPKDIFTFIDKEFKRITERHNGERLTKAQVLNKPQVKANRTGLLSKLLEKNSLLDDIRSERLNRLKKRNLYKNKISKRHSIKEKLSLKNKKINKVIEENDIKNRTKRNIIGKNSTDADNGKGELKSNKYYKIYKKIEQSVIDDLPIKVGLVEAKEDPDTREEAGSESGLLITVLDSASNIIEELRQKMGKVWDLMKSIEN